MEGSFHRRAVFIFLFWILVPTFDQYTDIEMVTRLFIRGPSPDMNITSCKDCKKQILSNYFDIFTLDTFFPTQVKYQGLLKDQPQNIQTVYKKVIT